MCKSIKRNLDKKKREQNADFILKSTKVVDPNIITHGLGYALKTGNWGGKVRILSCVLTGSQSLQFSTPPSKVVSDFKRSSAEHFLFPLLTFCSCSLCLDTSVRVCKIRVPLPCVCLSQTQAGEAGVKTGVSQLLNRLTFASTLSHLRRLNTPIERSGKMAKPRQLHNTQWGMICPSETPEGQSVGLVKNMALMSTVRLVHSCEQDCRGAVLATFPREALKHLLFGYFCFCACVFAVWEARTVSLSQ